MASLRRTVRSHEFRELVEAAWVKAAIAIVSEDPGTDRHATRMVLAGKVLNGQAPLAQMAMAVGANEALADKIRNDNNTYPDDIYGVVETLITPYEKAIEAIGG